MSYQSKDFHAKNLALKSASNIPWSGMSLSFVILIAQCREESRSAWSSSSCNCSSSSSSCCSSCCSSCFSSCCYCCFWSSVGGVLLLQYSSSWLKLHSISCHQKSKSHDLITIPHLEICPNSLSHALCTIFDSNTFGPATFANLLTACHAWTTAPFWNIRPSHLHKDLAIHLLRYQTQLHILAIQRYQKSPHGVGWNPHTKAAKGSFDIFVFWNGDIPIPGHHFIQNNKETANQQEPIIQLSNQIFRPIAKESSWL